MMYYIITFHMFYNNVGLYIIIYIYIYTLKLCSLWTYGLNHPQVRYDGHGYVHLLEYIVPKMRERGISQDTINTILISNPKELLTFV